MCVCACVSVCVVVVFFVHKHGVREREERATIFMLLHYSFICCKLFINYFT
jgi:hypothetical protein